MVEEAAQVTAEVQMKNWVENRDCVWPESQMKKMFHERGTDHLQSSAVANSSKMSENSQLALTVQRFWGLTGMDLRANRREIEDTE